LRAPRELELDPAPPQDVKEVLLLPERGLAIGLALEPVGLPVLRRELRAWKMDERPPKRRDHRVPAEPLVHRLRRRKRRFGLPRSSLHRRPIIRSMSPNERGRVSIRLAEPADVEAVQACVRAAYSIYVERIGRPPAPMTADYEVLVAAGEVWVASEDEDVIGVLVIRPQSDSLFLENVAVAPARQGRGIGRALIDFVERRAAELGLPAVELYTNERMIENLSFYPALGYVETGRRRHEGFARVFFRKQLR
jgi:ribosomal protein S18 acetylase RimI-like enzyme